MEGNISFNTVPDGCLGGSIWSSPTIDAHAGIVYVSTGNPGRCSTPEPYAPALVKLRASDLSLLDAWQVPQENQVLDSDFGVAIVSEGPSFLVIATANGRTLFSYSDTHASFLGPASVSNGVLYIGSYTGGLYAFGL